MSFLNSVGLFNAIPDSTITRPQDTNSISESSYHGEILNPSISLSEVEVEISSNTSGINSVGIYETNGTLLDEDTSVSGSGDIGTLSGLSLQSGTDYNILVYNNGNSYTMGFESDNHPYTSDNGDLIDAIQGSSPGSTSVTGQVRVVNNVVLRA